MHQPLSPNKSSGEDALSHSVFAKLLNLYNGKHTRTEERIVQFLLQNKEILIDASITQLARATQSSEATWVRFARKLGYEGFPEFRREVLREVRAELRQATLPETFENLSRPELRNLAEQEIANISTTMRALDENRLVKVAQHLAQSPIIYTAGSGMSTFLAKIAAYQLSLIGLRSICLADLPLTYPEQMRQAQTNDSLICFAFAPYSSSTVEALSFAKKEAKLFTVLISDTEAADLAPLIDSTLVCATYSNIALNSMTSPLLILRTLVTLLLGNHEEKPQ